MKRFVRIAIILLFSFLLWSKWGGIANGTATLIILIVDAFLINVCLDDIVLVGETEETTNEEEYDQETTD